MKKVSEKSDCAISRKYTLLLQLCDIPTKIQLACSVPNLDVKISYPFASFNKPQKTEIALSLQKAFAVAATKAGLSTADPLLLQIRAAVGKVLLNGSRSGPKLPQSLIKVPATTSKKKIEGLLRMTKQQNRENTVITWEKKGH